MQGKIFGSTLLIAGTTIGGGMLALPTVTGPSGFLPAAGLLIGYWLFMLYTAFLFLEAVLSFPPGTNLVTMARVRLGRFGESAVWVIFLFLLYALTTAYLAGCNPLFYDWLTPLFSNTPPSWIGYFPLLIFFGFFIYKGYEAVDFVNRSMMIGMMICFLFILYVLSPHVSLTQLTKANFSALPASLSIVSVSFGYHIIIPSLADYLNRDVRLLKKSLFIGSLIPLVVYLVWEAITLGIIKNYNQCPVHDSLISACDDLYLFQNTFTKPILANLFKLFSFFLIVTSFLGVSLSLFDFLSDGFKIPKSRMGRGSLYILTFGPPLAINLHDPESFLKALEYAGAYGVVTLLAIVPSCLVYFGRKQRALSSYKAPGGGIGILLVLVLSLGIIFHELFVQLYG